MLLLLRRTVGKISGWADFYRIINILLSGVLQRRVEGSRETEKLQCHVGLNADDDIISVGIWMLKDVDDALMALEFV